MRSLTFAGWLHRLPLGYRPVSKTEGRMNRFAAWALAAVAWANSGQAATIDEMKSRCSLGKEAAERGLDRLDGAITVSPREAKCAIDQFSQLLVVEPMRDIKQLPRSVLLPLLAVRPLGDADASRSQATLTELTGGDKQRPILVYCHDEKCGYSVTAAGYLRQWGYPNVLWLREGVAGWKAAGYPFVPVEKLARPVGEAAWTLWVQTAAETASGCLQLKDSDTCDLRALALGEMFKDRELPLANRDMVARLMFETLATSAAMVRENPRKFKSRSASEEAKQAYESLERYAALVGRPGVYGENAGVVREYAITQLLAGNPEAAEAALARARADGRAEYARLESARPDAQALRGVRSTFLAMEQLERGIAEFAAGKAREWQGINRAEASPWQKRALEAIDRSLLWIARNEKEGVIHPDDPDYAVRMSTLLASKGDLLKGAGDEAGARRAYGLATAVCSLPAGKDRDQAASCRSAQDKYQALASGRDRWSVEQAGKELGAFLEQLRD